MEHLRQLFHILDMYEDKYKGPPANEIHKLGSGHKLKSPRAGGDFENSQKFLWPRWNFMENFMTPLKLSKEFRDPDIFQTSFSYMFALEMEIMVFTPTT